MQAKLTTNRIERLETTDKQYFVWDDKFTGLGVRVSPGGSKTFIYQSRIGGTGTPKRITIGKYPKISLQDAIDRASELSKQMVAGIDPSRQKAENIAKNAEFIQQTTRNSITLGDAYTDYITTHKADWSDNYYKDHLASVRPHLNQSKYAPQPIGNIWSTPLVQLTPDFVESWIAKENATRATTMAKNFRMFKAFCNWTSETAKYADLIPSATYQSKKINKRIAKVKSHKLALQRQQLKPFFEAVSEINDIQRACIIAMLLNGSRPNEMLTLTWANVDFNWKTITIIDKVDQWERVIPLTPYVEYLLKNLPRINDFIFASTKSESGHIWGMSDLYDKALAKHGLPMLSPKSMRKSFSNLSEWVGVSRQIVNQIMGHRPKDIDEKHYKDRPIDLLRHWHVVIERFILAEGGIDWSLVYPDLTYDEIYSHVIS